MVKEQLRQKKLGKFWSGKWFSNSKILNYFNKVENPYFSIYCQTSTQKRKVKSN